MNDIVDYFLLGVIVALLVCFGMFIGWAAWHPHGLSPADRSLISSRHALIRTDQALILTIDRERRVWVQVRRDCRLVP